MGASAAGSGAAAAATGCTPTQLGNTQPQHPKPGITHLWALVWSIDLEKGFKEHGSQLVAKGQKGPNWLNKN